MCVRWQLIIFVLNLPINWFMKGILPVACWIAGYALLILSVFVPLLMYMFGQVHDGNLIYVKLGIKLVVWLSLFMIFLSKVKDEAEEATNLYRQMVVAAEAWKNDFDLEYWIHRELAAYLPIISGRCTIIRTCGWPAGITWSCRRSPCGTISRRSFAGRFSWSRLTWACQEATCSPFVRRTWRDKTRRNPGRRRRWIFPCGRCIIFNWM